jgi:hypothetical protein
VSRRELDAYSSGICRTYHAQKRIAKSIRAVVEILFSYTIGSRASGKNNLMTWKCMSQQCLQRTLAEWRKARPEALDKRDCAVSARCYAVCLCLLNREAIGHSHRPPYTRARNPSFSNSPTNRSLT